eukprot:39882_1
MSQPTELPNISSNYLPCGCHAHTTPAPNTFFNIHLHGLLSKATNIQIATLFSCFESEIHRILLSQFIDRISLENKLTFEQQSYYMNTFNHAINPSTSTPYNHASSHYPFDCVHHHEQPMHSDANSDAASVSSVTNGEDSFDNIEDLDSVELNAIEQYMESISDPQPVHIPHTLPDDVWSRIFQFVDQQTRLFSLPLCSRSTYTISTSPCSWIHLQIRCSPIYFNFKNSYLFSNFLMRSGRCISTLVLRDIGSMNESHWKHFIDYLTHCCPKIVNVRIRSSMTQNGIRNKSTPNNTTQHDESSLFHQLIGSNLHHHQYHHYCHNKQIETILKYSNAAKSNIFNTLQLFIRHYKKYGGLLIPQNTLNITNVNHASHLSGHRITAIDSSFDDSLGNMMFNMLRNDRNEDDMYLPHNDDEEDKTNDDHPRSVNHLLHLNVPFAVNPFFYISPVKHDLLSHFSFSQQIAKYERNELQPELHNNTGGTNTTSGANNTTINILQSFCRLSLHQLKTNCVIRPKNLCSFLQKQPYLVVLKASVRYRRDWSESENEWFWKIPACLPSNLEIFFLPGHHALPELWVENCLSRLRNLSYFDFFIVNNKYIPSVSINTIYILAKHCHKIQFVHLHINLDHYLQNRLKQTDHEERESDAYVLFTKELGNALQLLFANCLKLQRVYCYLPIKFDPKMLLKQIVFVQLPSKRKCKLRIDEYKIGGVKCRRFVFKLMDDVNSVRSKIQ